MNNSDTTRAAPEPRLFNVVPPYGAQPGDKVTFRYLTPGPRVECATVICPPNVVGGQAFQYELLDSQAIDDKKAVPDFLPPHDPSGPFLIMANPRDVESKIPPTPDDFRDWLGQNPKASRVDKGVMGKYFYKEHYGIDVDPEKVLDAALFSSNLGAYLRYRTGEASDGTKSYFWYACQKGDLDLVHNLIEVGGPEIVEKKEKSGRTVLFAAAAYGHVSLLKYLVEEQNARTDIIDASGLAPIHHAARYGSLETVQYLIENQTMGVNVESRTKRGQTALHEAAARGKLSVVKFLIEGAAADKNATDIEHGNTPLHLAAYYCKFDVVKYFVASGAALDILNHNGVAARHYTRDITIRNLIVGACGFKVWMQQHGEIQPNGQYSTNLEQQLSCAKLLYDEGQPTTEPDISVKEIIRRIQSCPFVEEGLVRWKGISVDWFLDVFAKTEFMQRLIEYGCELWFVRKVCMVELLRRTGVNYSGALIDHIHLIHNDGTDEFSPIVKDVPTVFLSYTGRYELSGFVAVLEQLRGEYIWMDVFCVDQFAWTGKNGTPEMEVFRDQLLKDLQKNIKRINRVVLLLEFWNDAVYTIQQIWVLWEVFNAVASNTDFSILLDPSEHQQFVRSIFYGTDDYYHIMANLLRIDCDSAVAMHDSDRVAILTLMKNVGLYNVSCAVSQAVRKWLCGVAYNHAQTLLVYRSAGREVRGNIQVHGHTTNNSVLWNSIGRVAKLLFDYGFLDLAGQLYMTQLSTYKDIAGRDETKKSLALVLYAQGRLVEALSLVKDVLDASMKQRGESHTTTLDFMQTFAGLLVRRGEFEEAELWCRKVLQHRDKVPITLQVLAESELAICLERSGKYDEAAAMYQQTLARFNQLPGDQVQRIGANMGNYAILLKKQGKFEEAESLLMELLLKLRRILGSSHRDTLMLIAHLASAKIATGQLHEAESLAEEALSGMRQRTLGHMHQDTLTAIAIMGDIRINQGRLLDAELLYMEALHGFRQVLGNENTDTLLLVAGLGSVKLEIGKINEAEQLLVEARTGFWLIHENSHRNSLASMRALGELKIVQENFDEAEQLITESLTGFREIFGDDHFETFAAVACKGRLLFSQGARKQAEQLLKQALSGLVRHHGSEHYTCQKVKAILQECQTADVSLLNSTAHVDSTDQPNEHR